MKKNFAHYGELEYLEPDEFYAVRKGVGAWTIVDSDEADDGNCYDIITNASGEWRYTTV